MSIEQNISIIDISQIDYNCRLSAAYLIMESLPDYYVVNGIDDTEMATAIAGLIAKSGSEIESGFIAICNNKAIGILTYICSESLPSARLIGTQSLMRQLSKDSTKNFLTNLRSYNTGFEVIPNNNIYLSRFAVDKQYRGKGLAGQLISKFLSMENFNSTTKKEASLHVNKDNKRAISFYHKCHFTISNEGEKYLTMAYTPNNINRKR